MENSIKDKGDRFDQNFTVTFYFDEVIEASDTKEGKADESSLDLQNFLRVRENNLKDLARKRKDTLQREGAHRRRQRAIASQDNTKSLDGDATEEDDTASIEEDELGVEHVEDLVEKEEEEDDIILGLNITEDDTYMDEDSYIEDESLITCENT